MSAPHPSRSIPTIPTIDCSFVLDDRSYSETSRREQYPEVNREHEMLEVTKDYPEVVPDQKRTWNYRALGVRPWVLVVVMCVVAIATAIAVGLAIGMPALNRKHDTTDFTTRPPSTNALAASDVTSSRSLIGPLSATASTTPTSISSTSSTSIPQTPSSSSSSSSPTSSSSSSSPISCPANDSDIITTFSNSDGSIPDQLASHNLKYKINCKRDYPPYGDVKDMFAITVGNLAECIKRCSAFNLELPVPNQSFPWMCSGVALVESTCTLKKQVTVNATIVPRQDMVGSAILVWDD